MASHYRSRRSQPVLNPFVAFSDITLSIILLLSLYFSALFSFVQAEKNRYKSLADNWKDQYMRSQHKIAEGQQKLDQQNQLIEAYLPPDQQKRLKKVKDYEREVARVCDADRLKPFHGSIQVRSGDTEQVFSFGAELLFESGRAKLSDRGRHVIAIFADELASKLTPLENLPEIEIQGHTDEQKADNWTLSMERSLSVVQVFSTMLSGDARRKEMRARLHGAGFSCHSPVVVGTKPDQPANRRIEVRLLYRTESGKQYDSCDCDVRPSSKANAQ